MKILNTSLNKLSEEKTLRQDFDYNCYRQNTDNNCYSFNELFEIVSAPKLKLEEISDNFSYCEIGDVDKNGFVSAQQLNKAERNLLNENYFAKIENGDIISVEKNDILLSKVRPNLKKYVRITEANCAMYFTSAFMRLKPKKIPVIIYYCLRNQFFEAIMSISRQGKGYPTINEKDIKELTFDKFIIDSLCAQQEELTRIILQIENQIEKLICSITPTKHIIDSILQRRLNFNYSKFNDLVQIINFTSSLLAFANNPDLRFSAKFHRPAGDYVQKELNSNTTKKFKHYLAEPIILGASITPKDFDETGETYYVSMASIKNLIVEYDDSQLVSSSYQKNNSEKMLRKGDIVMARSGVAIGKTALVTEDVDSIFADFTMRIRLKNYNPLFAYYYIRSTYFQYLIEIYKKGLQNQNIFPIVVREFPIPDFTLEEQRRIVEEIQKEIDKQNHIKDKIQSLRNQIDEIIEETVKAATK